MAQLNNQVQTLATIALEICFDQDTSSTHLLPLQLDILCSTLDLCLFGSSVSGLSVKIHCLAYRFLAKFVGHLNFTKCSKFFCMQLLNCFLWSSLRAPSQFLSFSFVLTAAMAGKFFPCASGAPF